MYGITQTLTRADLAEGLYREIGLSKKESSELVDQLIETIANKLCSGEMVKLAGFGSFKVRDKVARLGRNPKTGKTVEIEPRRVVTFKPSPMMKERVDYALTSRLAPATHSNIKPRRKRA